MAEVLFIYPSEETKLPEDFHFNHNFSVHLYDQLVSLIKDNDLEDKISVSLDISDNLEQYDEKKEHVLDWMKRNGFSVQYNTIISLHTFFSVLSDTIQFIFSALHCAKNMRLTVSYNLVRKPFLENVLILEQIFTEEDSFLRNFESNPENFDPGKLKKERKMEIISKCLKKANIEFLRADHLYESRYDTTNSSSIYALSNLATHLVTTRHDAFKTESQNLNFVFSNLDQWESQAEHFYQLMPFQLIYLLEITDYYCFTKGILPIMEYKRRRFYRLVGFFLFGSFLDEELTSPKSSFQKIVRKTKIKCLKCKKNNLVFMSDIYSFIHDRTISCKHCLVDLVNQSHSLDPIIEKLIHNPSDG